MKASTPDALIRRAASVAADSVEPIIKATLEVAGEFSRRELGRAQADLSDLFRTLRTLTVITSRLAGHGLAESGDAGELYDGLMRTLDEFAKRQLAEDWDGVAQLLTDDLQQVLVRWPATLRAFANRAYAADILDPADVLSARAGVRS